MSIELSRPTFRRLVQVYLFSLMISVAVLVFETIAWSDFVEAFDGLTAEHFGTATDLQLFSLGGIGLAGGIAHVVAAFGLLRFKWWSRRLLWMSLLPMLGFGFIPGFQVAWTGVWSTWVELIGLGFLGAILLLAYACGCGDVWFERQLKENP